MDIILIIVLNIVLNFFSVFYVVEIQKKYLLTKFPFFGTYQGRFFLNLINSIIIVIIVVNLSFLLQK